MKYRVKIMIIALLLGVIQGCDGGGSKTELPRHRNNGTG